MKIVVVSDSHGCNMELDYVLNKEKDGDLFLHCGDICVDQYVYPKLVTVKGNNDLYNYPIERIINITGHRILMLHSHTISYFGKEEILAKRAKENDCDIVCFGHTHIPYYKVIDNITLLNPGSLYHNRNGSPISYAIIRIKNTEVSVKHKYIEEEAFF